MKISRITLYAAPIELSEPFVISLGPLTHANNVFVRMDTDEGATGWGEASPFPTIHGETMEGIMTAGYFLARHLLGLDPRPDGTGPRPIDRMDQLLAGNACVKSAFEIACYDLAAQSTGQPLYAYLGADHRSVHTDYTVSLGSPGAMAAKALWVKTQGFRSIKLKLGYAANDFERVDAVTRAVGTEIPLRLDANQGWTVAEARALLPRLQTFNVQHCEAPIDRRDYPALPALKATTSIPLMADEALWDHEDARRLIELDAVSRFNIKLSKSSGFTKALKILKLAQVRGLPVQVGGFLESRLGFTAAAHFGLLPGVAYYDLDTPLMQGYDPVSGGIRYEPGGKVTVPKEPAGLGARLDPSYAATLRKLVVE